MADGDRLPKIMKKLAYPSMVSTSTAAQPVMEPTSEAVLCNLEEGDQRKSENSDPVSVRSEYSKPAWVRSENSIPILARSAQIVEDMSMASSSAANEPPMKVKNGQEAHKDVCIPTLPKKSNNIQNLNCAINEEDNKIQNLTGVNEEGNQIQNLTGAINEEGNKIQTLTGAINEEGSISALNPDFPPHIINAVKDSNNPSSNIQILNVAINEELDSIQSLGADFPTIREAMGKDGKKIHVRLMLLRWRREVLVPLGFLWSITLRKTWLMTKGRA